MQLNDKTLEKLRNIINGDGVSIYRKGYQLVDFFNELGFQDKYGQGFPSRHVYTDEKLKRLNGTPELDKCIRQVFAVQDYMDQTDVLDTLIADFNKHMAFDKWQVARDNDLISFKKIDKVIINSNKSNIAETREDDFLKQTFNINIDLLGIDANVCEIIKQRLIETEICVGKGASLAAVFLIGSIMEGILLGVATLYPAQYNQSLSAPKDGESGKVKKYHEWTLNNFIDVSSEIGILNQDVRKFSHVVRDFRNYIHPYAQMSTNFSPDKQTALICMQVLKAAISQISTYRKNNQRRNNNG